MLFHCCCTRVQNVQRWRGLILHPLKCANGCCCKDEAPPKRYTVSARIMDVPQGDQSFPTFMFGISGLVLVVNAYAGAGELRAMRETLRQALDTLPVSPRNGLPVPLVVLECDTAPQPGRARHTTWELVDRLDIAAQCAASPDARRRVSWVCKAASASTGAGLLEVSQWIGRMYNVHLTIRTDD